MLSHDIRYTELKIQRRLELLQAHIFRRSAPLSPFRLKTLDHALTPPPLTADPADWEVIEPNTYWGIKHLNFALAGSFTIPAEFETGSPAALHLPFGDAGDFDHPEALIYVDGEAYGAVDKKHYLVYLPERWRDGSEHRLLLHGWCGLMGGTHVPAGRKLHMGYPAVVQVDVPTRQFIALARNAWAAAKFLDEHHPAKARLWNALDHAFTLLDTRDPIGEAFYASIPAAMAALESGIAAAGEPLDVLIASTGHAHIDTAWMWTVDQTRRKAERTFYNVIRLMEEFPFYNFVQSQPQLYDYVRQDHPALFELIKQRVAEKRWEPIGGMWVEADCNLSGSESLVRQFLLGRTFFRQHFGAEAESPVLWLPDVFGYAWNLPQLIKGAGLEYFFTIKIGWNQYNRLPYDSFWWQGLDGTRVLTHFSTAPEAWNIKSRATYNAEVDAMIALGTWINYQQKHLHNEMLMSYGWGDGGGGPTREMLENVAVLDRIPGVPAVQSTRVGDFFHRMETEAGSRLPVWNGELYLEAHRGTYTTQARNKRWNRKSEFMLHDAEYLATVASLMDKAYVYPHEALRKAWEIVCLHQFHDIIPGSSVGEVYADSERYYAEVRAIFDTVESAALDVIRQKMGGDLLLINPSGAYTNDLARTRGAYAGQVIIERETNSPLVLQDEGVGESALVKRYGGNVGYSITPLTLHDAADTSPIVENAWGWGETSTSCLDNGMVRVELNAAGDITRIYYYPLEREVLPPGMIANQFQAFEDRPNNWDAWDIDIFFEDRMTLAAPADSIRIVESGDLRRTLEIRRTIQHSTFIQRISLVAEQPYIDFDTSIDWDEKHTLLKVAFPVNVLATRATHEVQWGNVERATTRNHSWDWGRFETCAHKWVHIGESDFGVALINDCKYGHDVKDNVIRLSLLRAPTAPDEHADEGTHLFAYRLLIDADVFDTAQSAYAFNDPAFIVPGSGSPSTRPAFTFVEPALTAFDQAMIHVETIKRAEDDNGVIVRLYEYGRTRGSVTLTFGFPLRAASVVNLMEEHQRELAVSDGSSVTLEITPFQIVTLRLIPDLE
ncbi:MAG: glycoside hydrolase family 38 C-terminal domain-containing protein [bacterium]|nr:glycoside hydrolase family 38 C-terminal domain-containing protein [bacterium]